MRAIRALTGTLALLLAASAVGYGSGGCLARPTRNPYRDARIAAQYEARALAENPFDAASLAPQPSADPLDGGTLALSRIDPWGSTPASWIARLGHDSAWPEIAQSRLIPPRVDQPATAPGGAGVTIATPDRPVLWRDLSPEQAALLSAALDELDEWQGDCDELRAASGGQIDRIPNYVVALLRVMAGTLEVVADVPDAAVVIHALRLPSALAAVLPAALSRVLRSVGAAGRAGQEARRLAVRALACCADAGGVRALIERLGDQDKAVCSVALRGAIARGRVLQHEDRIGVLTRLVDLLDPTDPVAAVRVLLHNADRDGWQAAWDQAAATALWLSSRWERFGPALVDPEFAPLIERARAAIADRADQPADPLAVQQLLAWIAPLLPPAGTIATRCRAILVLRELSRRSMRYRPEASTLARRLATSRWRVWLMSIESETSTPAAKGSPAERSSAASSTSLPSGRDADTDDDVR